MAGQMWDLAQTKIGCAISAGNVSELKSLIVQGEDVLHKDKHGNTYLHYVCTMYRPSIFYNLIAAGIDVNAQNRHGNTPLHVTALQHECCHVGDLMACGADPSLKNTLGKTPSQVGSQNQYWYMIYEKYKPGIFQVVKDHDIPRLYELLHSWCRVDTAYGGQSLRQYAASLKFHDIVCILDDHEATMNMVYGVLEGNHKKVKEALKKTRCWVNYVNKVSQRKHILQYAIQFRDHSFVRMLCKAGADVNYSVRVNNYFWGPLYFEAIHTSVPIEITWEILKSGADFSIKDERGRTAFMYALDRYNGEVPLDIFKFLLNKGCDIAQRDNTGCTARDIARFAQRRDVADLIDRFYVNILRASDIDTLHRFADYGYDSLLIYFNYRDAFIYASGNETDDVLKFVQWLPNFQETVKKFHYAIVNGSVDVVKGVLENCDSPERLIKTRNKALRTPLMQSVLHGKVDVVMYFLSQSYDVDINARDCCNCTAYHFACSLPEDQRETIKQALKGAGIDTTLQDNRGRMGEDYSKLPDSAGWLAKERKAVYGMDIELACLDKYEALRRIIRAKRKDIKDFMAAIKNYKFPVVALCRVLSPIMPTYRDLIFLAVDYGKVQIANRLADLGADLCRRENYVRKTVDGRQLVQSFNPEERALHLGMVELAQSLAKKRALQMEKKRSQEPLLPRRVLQRHSDIITARPKSVFVTQLGIEA